MIWFSGKDVLYYHKYRKGKINKLRDDRKCARFLRPPLFPVSKSASFSKKPKQSDSEIFSQTIIKIDNYRALSTKLPVWVSITVLVSSQTSQTGHLRSKAEKWTGRQRRKNPRKPGQSPHPTERGRPPTPPTGRGPCPEDGAAQQAQGRRREAKVSQNNLNL